jgi:divalent metal cation (Fe/Co/Zn/Cd) transporter
MDRSLKIALGSLGVSLVVLAVKFTAYLITGSLALYSDALKSIINVATSIAAIIAIRIAARPPDAEHSYGYPRAQVIA